MLYNNDTICKTMQTIAYSKKLSQAFGANTMYMLRSVQIDRTAMGTGLSAHNYTFVCIAAGHGTHAHTHTHVRTHKHTIVFAQSSTNEKPLQNNMKTTVELQEGKGLLLSFMQTHAHMSCTYLLGLILCNTTHIQQVFIPNGPS